MEGKATLTLTDAKSGRVVKKVTEHNLVTDAVKRILNPPVYAMLYSFNFPNFINNVMPASKLFSGIMLLGNTLSESRENVMLSGDYIPVATAGGEYAGANVRRGTLNTNESYATANGYHFTWDFGTDKANGVIKSVALTSQYFGNSAFENMGNEGKLFADPSNITAQFSETTQFFHARGQYIGTFQDRLHLYITYNGNTVTFLKYRSPNPADLGINDPGNLSGWPAAESSVSVELPITLNYILKAFVDTSKKLMYFFTNTRIEQGSGDRLIDYAAVDLNTLAVVKTGTQNIKDCATVYSCAVVGDRFYVMCYTNIQVFTLGGGWLKTYNIYSQNSSFFSMWEDMLVASVGVRKIAVFDSSDNMYVYYNPEDYLPAYSCDIKPPFYPMSYFNMSNTDSSNSSWNPYLGLSMGYLATINNLTEPLEKTSEHNLKISYDITNQ